MENYSGFIPQPEKQFQYSSTQASIFLGFVLLGIVLKLQHWPGSALSILVASGGLTGYNFVALLLLRGKHVVNLVLMIAGAFWLIILVWGLVMNNGHPYNEYGVMIYSGALVVTAVINGLVYRKYFVKAT